MKNEKPVTSDHFYAAGNNPELQISVDTLSQLALGITGVSDKTATLEVAYSTLHPERPINREQWRQKPNWEEIVDENVKIAAANVIGHLLLAQGFSDPKRAAINRRIIGLPKVTDHLVVERPSLEPKDVAADTGLSPDRVIHRRYEAISALAAIWDQELGPTSTHSESYTEDRNRVSSRLNEVFGQLAYPLRRVLLPTLKNTIALLYLDKLVYGAPTDSLYKKKTENIGSNPVGTYNRWVKTGRNLVLKRLTEQEIEDPELEDQRREQALMTAAELRQDSSVDTFNHALKAKPQPIWLDAENIALFKLIIGGVQHEPTLEQSFRIAELQLELERFDPENMRKSTAQTVLEYDDLARRVMHVFKERSDLYQMSQGLEAVELLLDYRTLGAAADEAELTGREYRTQLRHGLKTLLLFEKHLGDNYSNEKIAEVIRDDKLHIGRRSTFRYKSDDERRRGRNAVNRGSRARIKEKRDTLVDKGLLPAPNPVGRPAGSVSRKPKKSRKHRVDIEEITDAVLNALGLQSAEDDSESNERAQVLAKIRLDRWMQRFNANPDDPDIPDDIRTALNSLPKE